MSTVAHTNSMCEIVAVLVYNSIAQSGIHHWSEPAVNMRLPDSIAKQRQCLMVVPLYTCCIDCLQVCSGTNAEMQL